MAALPLPTCRIGARCCACRMRSGPGRSAKPEEIDKAALARVFAAANGIDTLIIGTGTDVWLPPPALREALRAVRVVLDTMQTGPAVPHLQHHDRRAAACRSGADRGAMSGAVESRQSAGFCAELVRAHDFTRYASTLFVPAAQRRALLALYAFNVEISRVHVQVSQPLPGEMRLQWWTRHAGGHRPWRRRGQSGRGRTAAGDPRTGVCRSSGCRA